MLQVAYKRGQAPKKTKKAMIEQMARDYAIRNIEKAVRECEPEYREEVKRRMLIKYNLI